MLFEADSDWLLVKDDDWLCPADWLTPLVQFWELPALWLRPVESVVDCPADEPAPCDTELLWFTPPEYDVESELFRPTLFVPPTPWLTWLEAPVTPPCVKPPLTLKTPGTPPPAPPLTELLTLLLTVEPSPTLWVTLAPSEAPVVRPCDRLCEFPIPWELESCRLVVSVSPWLNVWEDELL